MKKKIIMSLLFVGLISTTAPVQAGFFESVGNTIRYSTLAVKNTGKAIGYGAKNTGLALGFGAKVLFWDTPSEIGKFAWHHKAISTTVSATIITTLIALWYTSPNGFTTHPWVIEGATKITGLSAEALELLVQTTTAMLQGGLSITSDVATYTASFIPETASKATAEWTRYIVAEAARYAIAILEQGPAYAQWIRETSCHYTNQNCSVQTLENVCTKALVTCAEYIPKRPACTFF